MRGKDVLFVHLGRATLGTRDKCRAHLRCLRTQRQHGGDARAIHDATCGHHRDFHRAHNQARQRKGAGHRFIGVTQIRAAMPAGFATLGDDEIHAQGFKVLRFGDARCAATGLDAE